MVAGGYERPSGNARTSSAIRGSTAARRPAPVNSRSACSLLARANGATIRLAAQLDSLPARIAVKAASGNPDSSCRRRLTQLTSRPQRRARSCCDSPRPCISSRISKASSMLANGRFCVRANTPSSASVRSQRPLLDAWRCRDPDDAEQRHADNHRSAPAVRRQRRRPHGQPRQCTERSGRSARSNGRSAPRHAVPPAGCRQSATPGDANRVPSVGCPWPRWLAGWPAGPYHVLSLQDRVSLTAGS